MLSRHKASTIVDFAVVFVAILIASALILIAIEDPQKILNFLNPQTPTPAPMPAPQITSLPATPTPTPIASPSLSPTPQTPECAPFGKCFATKPDYCKNGVIVANCKKCGCLNGFECDNSTGICSPQ